MGGSLLRTVHDAFALRADRDAGAGWQSAVEVDFESDFCSVSGVAVAVDS